MEWSFLRNFAITLFALLNPLGMLPIFISYVGRERLGVQRWLALFISGTVLGLLLLFMLTGASVLQFFGVTLNSFRIAGGILLLIIGINIVNGVASKTTEINVTKAKESDLTQAQSIYRQIVIPMAMPLLVGPGVIANVILYASEAEAKKGSGLLLGLILMTILVSFFVFVILLSGRELQRMIGDTGLSIAQRTLGLFVAAIGVQFIVTGLTNIIVVQIVPEILKLR
ncbi:Genome sequencing data, contig C314 [Planktothrix sp. PCC 11201]|uniref:MarC family protein n=1 Tax=Planktothrix sp. PCC 11201 TaxID=1729650 RepID=UPI00092088BE|nr:MarC family protein [Planktothrix sp. PCC 11201]SKB15010.1 Genome sequencing data, contig C314 [Planktothrix sp. PCC 11201]